jgi:hypothetical protein
MEKIKKLFGLPVLSNHSDEVSSGTYCCQINGNIGSSARNEVFVTQCHNRNRGLRGHSISGTVDIAVEDDIAQNHNSSRRQLLKKGLRRREETGLRRRKQTHRI